jgi:transposase
MQIENYSFKPEEIQRLEFYRDQQTDGRLQKRFIALLMIAEGISLQKTKRILGIAESTIRQWFKQYHLNGIESLNSFQYQPKASYLTKEQEAELQEWVKKNPPQIES